MGGMSPLGRRISWSSAGRRVRISRRGWFPFRAEARADFPEVGGGADVDVLGDLR